MPTIAEAIATNNARIARSQNNPIEESLRPAPTPPQDAPAGLGLPQRGMFAADLVLASDRSDSSRVFRGAGMRSAVFPYSTVVQKGSAPTVTQPPTAIPTPTPAPTPTPTPTPVTPSGAANEVYATPDGVAGPASLRSLVYDDFPTSGVTAGSYTNTNLTVNAEGIITAASNGSSGTGVNLVQATVDFSNPDAFDGQDTTAQVVVTGQSWVTINSIIVVAMAGGTADHPDPDEPAVEDIVVSVGNLVAGVGFTISAYAPNRTWGQYFVNAMGV